MKNHFKSILVSLSILLFASTFSKAQIGVLKDYQNTNSPTIGTFMGVSFREGGFSGMYPIPNTNGTEFWVLSDRGVNVDCGSANLSTCRPTYDKMYAFPTFSPKIYRIRLKGSSVEILKTITVKRPDGTGATGLLNPTGFGSTAAEVPSTDTVLTCSRFNLKTVTKDIWGTDPEGIAVDKQGNFWICEEGGPTIWKLNSNGVVLNRFTPYANQVGAQPQDIYIDSVFKYRKNNRGFEGLSITPNGKIYAMIQSPILYPTTAVGEGTRVHRIIEIDPTTNATKMYAYLNDGIIGASGSNQIRLRDWKIGDMAAINDSTFLVLEAALRGTGDKRSVYIININGATAVNSGLYGGKTLEALVDSAGLAGNGIKPVKKKLFMDLLANGWDPTLDKAEGLAIINDSTIAIGNDNDFGQTCPLANGIPIATSITSHVVTYRLKGSNKLVNLKQFQPLLSQGTTGPNSSKTPYLETTIPGGNHTSILTVGDSIGSYKMCGIPDGLGAFDNGNGTFTLLMNHELGNTVGVTRAHGSIGAFVSKWVINKNDLSIVSGSDLIKNINLWNAGSYTTYNSANPSTIAAMNRFCSADLPPVSAFYNSATGLGTQERLFMNGEESGTEGRAFAHIATGTNAGTSYELPYLGKFAWENAVASPTASNKTVVAGLDDGSGGQVYFYIGTKTNTGNEIDKAGLSNGKLYGVAVSGLATELSTGIPSANTTFTLVDVGPVRDTTGSRLNTKSIALGITTFLRPEDGAWDPSNLKDFYFATTNSFTAPSRLWRLRFNDPANPEAGGTITAVLDGTEGPKMIDNLGIDKFGHILLQEDVGNQAHLGKMWQYTIATDNLKLIAQHDATRFVAGASNFLTQDEEASGIIDMQDILGSGMFMYANQAHYSQPGQLVEGGQLLAMFNPDTKNSFLGAGINSSQTPYLLPTAPGVKTNSLLTVGDSIGSYKMCGIPDGLGAFDNGNGTFTLLMNHELGNTVGVTRAHGSIGAFVSKWVINKNDLTFVSAGDLIKNINLYSAGTYTTYNSANPSTKAALNRLCSADLPPVSSFYNSATGLGTQERLFMNGEESGTEGRAFAHIATGVNAGTSWELPYLGKFAWENAVASPTASNKTVVAGLDDGTGGQVYFYIGTKTNTGNEIDKAGLNNGKLYGVAVSGLTTESSSSIPLANTGFNLVDLGTVRDSSGLGLNTKSVAAGVTTFLRPEDGAWDPSNLRDFYFATTNSFTAPSRLWRLRFNDANNPEMGGTITAVLDGTEGPKMIDNLTLDNYGHILLQEDVGNQTHLGKIWQYTVATDALTLLAYHDSTRFLNGAANYLTQDEESSGIIDMQAILGAGMFMYVSQAHYATTTELVEGGQLLTLFNPDTKNSTSKISVTGNNITIALNDETPSFADNTDFGDVMKKTSKILPFVIKNAGPGELIVKSIRFDGYDAQDFSLISPTSFPFTVAANGSQTINVQFEPKAIGGKVASIIIFNNDFDKPEFEYILQGFATANASIAISAVKTNHLMVYPNPNSTGVLNFSKTISLEIVDYTGRTVKTATKVKELNISELSKGIYFLKTSDGETKKFIVQ